MMRTRLLISRSYSPAVGVFFIQQLGRFRIHESCAGNDRRNFSCSAIEPTKLSGEGTADDAFLNPGRTLGEFSICGQAGELRARTRAAPRAVISFARALDKIARMSARSRRRRKKLNMINLGKSLRVQS